MKNFDNVLISSITGITISLVVMLGFFAAYDTRSIIMDKGFKKQTVNSQNEPKSHLNKFSKSPLIQTAVAEHSTEPLSIKVQNITAVSNPTTITHQQFSLLLTSETTIKTPCCWRD
jgi:hypothetical protein